MTTFLQETRLEEREHSQTFEELLSQWLQCEEDQKKRLVLIEKSLLNISQTTEQKTLDLTHQFQTLYTNSIEQNQRMQELMRLSNSLEVNNSVVKIEDIAQVVKQALENTMSHIVDLSKQATLMVHSVDDAARTLVQIEKSIKDIELINKKTKHLSINAMIEAVKDGHHQESAMIVANEVKELANDTKKIATGIGEQAHQMHSILNQAQKILQDVASIDIQESLQARQEIESMIHGLVLSNQKIGEIAETTTQSNHQFSETTSNLIKGIQFQDRLMQDIHRLMQDLKNYEGSFSSVKTETFRVMEAYGLLCTLKSDQELTPLSPSLVECSPKEDDVTLF
jgi:methyl-accepting chemotaxis protein